MSFRRMRSSEYFPGEAHAYLIALPMDGAVACAVRRMDTASPNRSMRLEDETSSWRRFRERVGAIIVLDHAGRAGNSFFLSVFDQHPDVLSCPLIQYTYSYALTLFGEHSCIPAEKIRDLWTREYYFRLLLDPMDDDKAALIHRFGGEPDAPLDRALIGRVFDKQLEAQTNLSRRDLCLLTFFCYALGAGRDVERVRFVMLSDSISLRFERALDGFSGSVVDHIVSDFPAARLIHLVRDPRAGFASLNHQYVNQLGNMFGLRRGHWRVRYARLRRADLDWDSVFVFGFWIIYFLTAWEAITRMKRTYPTHFMTVRNEDMNCAFVPTMSVLAHDLGIAFHAPWAAGTAFLPTLLGRPWHSAGAYNNRYQTKHSGPLANDPDAVSRRAVGPNVYVTKRWRTRLKRNEIAILEHCFAEEIAAGGYDFIATGSDERGRLAMFRKVLWQPLAGELPTLGWITRGRAEGMGEVLDRLFYAATFVPFSLIARLVLERLLRERGVIEAA